MKKLIIAIVMAVAMVSFKDIRATQSRLLTYDTVPQSCCRTFDSARIKSNQIKYWSKKDMTLDEAQRWILKRETLILPHVGTYRIMHDSAWKIN